MKKVLMITSEFPPPLSRGRKIRLAERAELGLNYGWETIVLVPGMRTHCYACNKGKNKIRVYQVGDPLRRLVSPLQKKAKQKEGMDQEHSRISMIWKIISPLFFPDPTNRWIIPMIITGKNIIKRKEIDVMYTMNCPFSLHVVGLILKKLKKIPWLAEFRDPWVRNTNPIHFIRGKAGLLHKIFERKVVECSDKIVFYNGVQMERGYFNKTYPYLPKNKFIMFPFVGFYPEKFRKVKPQKFDRFTISYAGSFYEGGCEPELFLLGLKNFMEKNRLPPRDLQVFFMGSWRSEYDLVVEKLNLKEVVHPCGRVPWEHCLSVLKGADLLLLIIRTYEGDELSVPLKVWDYIGVRKPILALVPRGWKAGKLVESEKLGIVVDPDEPEKIADVLEKFYFSKDRGLSLFSPSEEFLWSLDARKVEKSFCELLDEITLRKK